MKLIDYVAMSPIEKLIYRSGIGIKNLPKSLRNGFKSAGTRLRKASAAILNAIKTFFTTFKNGDFRTRLSYIFMGAGCFLRGQIVKGLGFLFIQASFIVYMVNFGSRQISLLPSLGKSVKIEVWNEELQIFEYIQGDNSMLILLFSVLTILVIFAFIVVYFSNIKIAMYNQNERENGRKLNNILKDIKGLFDHNLHVTFLALPSIGVIMFTILPLVFMILIAFTNYDKFHQPPGTLFTWVGFQNFKNIFFSDPIQSKTFSGILNWTITWAFFATFSNYILGMILALMINKKGIRFKKMWRTIFIVTIAVPQFVSLMLMSRLLSDLGAMNVLLGYLGIGPVQFLTNALYARITVVIVNIWVGIPYTMLILSGILMNIPVDFYESARIDGANVTKTFTKITLPYMLFVTTPYLITQFVGNINNFNVIYLLTAGGPLSLDYYQAGKTDLLVTWLYKLTVNQQDYNLASAIGIFIFIISATLSLIVYNLSSSAKKEDSFQ
ncbi:MAG: carbohydrate ABC transporter permease [Saccharofermentanales bacterium]